MGPLFDAAQAEHRKGLMEQSIGEIEEALETLQKGSPWDPNTKVSDEFLDPLFEAYFKKLNLPNVMRKTNYHQLAALVPRHLIDDEVRQKLDSIVEMSKRARPAGT